MEDTVGDKVKHDRLSEIMKVYKHSLVEANSRFLDELQLVLIEKVKKLCVVCVLV